MAADHKAYDGFSDEALMELVIRRDQAAFGKIYDRYADKLLGYFYRMLWQDKEKAEDFVQDLFMKIIRNPSSYDPSRPFRTWLFTVAANMCKGEYKRVEVRRTAAERIRSEGVTATTKDDLMNRVEYADFNAELEREVQQLDPHHRDVFILRYRQDLSTREISEVMGCSEGTVKSRLFYALRKLAGKLAHFNTKTDEIAAQQLLH